MAAQRWTSRLQDVLNPRKTVLKPNRRRQVTRVELAADESYVLPDDICEIRVIGGKAWICSDQKDMVAHHGQRIVFNNKDQVRTIVPLGQKPLVIDVYSRG